MTATSRTKEQIISELAEQVREQAHLISVLQMWGKVEAQGFDPEQVESFTFWEPFATLADKRVRDRARHAFRPDPFVHDGQVLKYNCVKLKDGTRHKLDPMIPRPE